jgi:hypothetical protein
MHENIKDYVFEVLPEGVGKWIVVAWGKIVNEQAGSYEQEIVLKRFSEKDDPSRTWDLRDPSKLYFCKVNLGSLRVLSPGTIIQGQKITLFPHEYLLKKDIKIEKPQELLKQPFRILYAPTFPGWERDHLISSVDKIETRVLEDPRLNVIVPCNVIADYYYYGMTYFIKAILEGRISSKFKNANDVYNPKTLLRGVSPTGEVVVRVELQRRMSYKDKVKIARLAHDDYFRYKCLDIATGIMNGNPDESYVNTDFPIDEPVTLSVYGVEINNGREKFFLVHSISKCSSKLPFDLVLAGKKFIGRTHFEDTKNTSGDKVDPNEKSLGISAKPGGRKRTQTTLSKGGKKNVNDDKPLWNSGPEDIPYDRDQVNNFPESSAINEKDFADPKKKEELTEILRKFGFAVGLTTNPNKRGTNNNLQLGLFATGPAKPKATPPTTAFQIIENLALLIEVTLTGRLHEVRSNIRCPVVEGVDKYSAFPVNELLVELANEKPERIRFYLNFCFMNVRENNHTQHRRVYIQEMTINGHVFYIMDVEPKYKVENKDNEVERFISSFGVIFYTTKSILDDDQLRAILKKIVTTYKGKSGRWRFLGYDYNYNFSCIQHRADQRSFDQVLEFILTRYKSQC